MAGIMAEKPRSSIVAPMKRQFSYLCCFNNNIERLRDEATELEDARARVAEARRTAEMNIPEADTWLENANTMIQLDLSQLEGDIMKVGNGCLNMKSRYLLSRKARITAEAMEELRASKEEILQEAAPIGIDSGKQMEKLIMEGLRGGEVHKIGISGMDGMGKTAMAKIIMNRAREEKLFDEVVMVQQADILRIQSEIAEALGLRLRAESLSALVHKLHAQLAMWPMRILLILDDVQEVLTLEDHLGISCGMIFTTFFTSRNENVLREMKAKEYIIAPLSEDEAWFLFRKKVGTWIDGSDLLSLAKEIVKECNGLPLGLTIVGETLKNGRTERIWKDALLQLKKHDQPHVLYNPIILSFEFLDEDTKSLFMLCCFFPQGYDIHIEYLTLCSIGLHMFAGTPSVEEARYIVRTAFKMLKARTLMLDGRDENHVRMHDAVRDAAMFLADREGRKGRWTLVQGNQINELPIRSSFPHLQFLKMDNDSNKTEISTVDPGFFGGMIELNVLSFHRFAIRSLPETTQLLESLRTLYLDGCTSLEKISIVGELLSLEILICRSCDMIPELPMEIGRLEKLRMLEVYKCRRLERIAPGVISKLVRLEELMIVESFNKWETEANGEQIRGNAAISEIEHLENLSRLEIEIEDSTLAAETMFLDKGKVKYQVRFGGSRGESCELYDTRGFARWIKDMVEYQWCHRIPPDHFFSRLEAIEIYDSSAGSLFNSSISVFLSSLKELRISKCKNMVKVIEGDTQYVFGELQVLFPSLRSLYLEDLPKLESFCSWRLDLPSLEKVCIKSCHQLEFLGMQNISTQNLEAVVFLKSHHGGQFPLILSNGLFYQVQLHSLKKVVICDCNDIGSLFSSSVAENLDNLKTLSISRCKEMVQVVETNVEREGDIRELSKVLFPNLKELEFRHLPKIQSFYRWEPDFELPSLENIDIYGCPLWKKFSKGSVSTPNLKRVKINSKVIDTGTLEW